MPPPTLNSSTGLNDDDISNELSLIPVTNDEHRKRLDEKRLDDVLKARQHLREQEARETEIRKITAETERMRLSLQFPEDERKRANEESNQRQKQEHEKELMKLKIEDSSNARQHELNLKLAEQEIIGLKLKLESENIKKDLELQRQKLQYEDNRHERNHKEKMASMEVNRLNTEDEIMRQHLDERRIATKEKQEQLSELRDWCEQHRKEEEQDMASLGNLSLAATGVAAASGAISGALATTASFGMAAGAAAGAATVLLPLSSTVAIVGATGYVIKKVISSNRA